MLAVAVAKTVNRLIQVCYWLIKDRVKTFARLLKGGIRGLRCWSWFNNTVKKFLPEISQTTKGPYLPLKDLYKGPF